MHALHRLAVRLNPLLPQDSGLTNADDKILAVLSEHPTGRMPARDLCARVQWDKSRGAHPGFSYAPGFLRGTSMSRIPNQGSGSPPGTECAGKQGSLTLIREREGIAYLPAIIWGSADRGVYRIALVEQITRDEHPYAKALVDLSWRPTRAFRPLPGAAPAGRRRRGAG